MKFQEIGEIFHVRMRLLDPPTGVAVQPLVQAEETGLLLTSAS